MIKNKRTVLAILLSGLMAVSFASCEKKTGNTTVQDNSSAEVTSAPAAETDSDGSMITYVSVTDADGKVVTNADNKPVTEAVLADNKGNIITDANGKNVAPNIKERIVTTASANKTNSEAKTKIDGKGPTLTIPSDLEATAGEEFKFKIGITDNTGYCSLIAYLDIEDKYFEVVDITGGDTDDANNKKSPEYEGFNDINFWDGINSAKKNAGIKCAVMLFLNVQSPIKGDTTFATVTLKVKDDVAPGKYDLSFDPAGDGSTLCNNLENLDSNPTVLQPTYVNGSVTIK